MERTRVTASSKTPKRPFSARTTQNQFTGETQVEINLLDKAEILVRDGTNMWKPNMTPEEKEEILARPNINKALKIFEENKEDPEAARVFYEMFSFWPDSYLKVL